MSNRRCNARQDQNEDKEQMIREKAAPPAIPDRGTRIALIFALAAERLTVFYEHHQWLTEAQGASLAADWLSRSKRALPLAERRHLSDLSDQLARQIAATLSREAGLYTSHEMMESLDPNYHSELAQSLMKECERLFDNEAEM
jgi:hypothetical protein